MNADQQLLVRKQGRRNSGARPPKLKDADIAMFVLMSNPGRWFVVRSGRTTSDWGALAVALWRRGCEVQQIDGVVRARWTHIVPSPATLKAITS